ncbi:MAG: hypothetical protein ACOCXA_05985, partial [Planctomycetota bacterium]
MRVLDRTLLTSVLRIQVLFSGVFVALISVAISAPVLRDGAPVEAVLPTLPWQVVFALPLT